VVDDEPALLRVLTAGLEARGYHVETATTGHQALAVANASEPDVVVLDLGLPDIDGIEVCHHLRRWLPSPVIVLTADGSEDRKIRALDEGADDYVTKPFSMPELLARLRVAVRHRRALAALVHEDELDVGTLHVDVAAHDAWIDGTHLDLARKEFALLTLLARNAGKVMTHGSLLEQVWGQRDSTDTQRLRTHIALLRKKLGEGPGRPRLVSEAGVGYRLLQPD
jgi:two-component system KDP operon response regulator KdpE